MIQAEGKEYFVMLNMYTLSQRHLKNVDLWSWKTADDLMLKNKITAPKDPQLTLCGNV